MRSIIVAYSSLKEVWSRENKTSQRFYPLAGRMQSW
jgi:hypothetical protein